MSYNGSGPAYQRPHDPDRQPQNAYQGTGQQYPYPSYQQPAQGYRQQTQPYQQPQPPAQQVGTYVPVMYVAKVPGSALGPLTLGIIGLLLFVLGISMPGNSGMFFGFTGILLGFIGAPIGVVTLVRRIRAKLPIGIPIAAVATNGVLVLLVLAAAIATSAS